MRYVVIIMTITFYVLWQSLYDDWHMTHVIMNELKRLWRMTGF